MKVTLTPTISVELGNRADEKCIVWFGEMEFCKAVFGADTDPSQIAIVHNIIEKRFMNPSEVEEHANGADWLIPSEFDGDIVFSRTFMRGLAPLKCV